MKMMLLCETDAEREQIARIFDKMEEGSKANTVKSYFSFYENNSLNGIMQEAPIALNGVMHEAPIVYARMGDTYIVYNFQTGKKSEDVEGDLAGLANLPEEDFPLI